jgi:hypothetical protein
MSIQVERRVSFPDDRPAESYSPGGRAVSVQNIPEGSQQPLPSPQPRESPVLDYLSPSPMSRDSQVWDILAQFAAGCALPLIVVSAILQEADLLMLAWFVVWGECGFLLLWIKIRRSLMKSSPRTRSWWVNLIAGIANTGAIYLIVKETTGRDPFWPALDMEGSQLLAIALTAIVSLFLAIILTPRGSH